MLVALLLACDPDTVVVGTRSRHALAEHPVDTAEDTGIGDSGDTASLDTADTADTAPVDTAPVDADGDGYASDEDCDDANAGTYPGAPEVCDGADQNCDGTPDNAAGDAPIWYPDTDGDGYGGSGAPMASCTQPEGYTADSTDCDDADPSQGPAPSWYVDTDGDGYGDPSGGFVACTAPVGYLRDSTDCDDSDPDVNPTAEEVWSTGADEDCDGAVDEDDAITGTWVGLVDFTFEDVGYCSGTYTCSGTASATVTADGTGDFTLSGSYSCTAAASSSIYGWCAAYTWAPSDTFELTSTGGAFTGSVAGDDCAPYGFSTYSGDMTAAGNADAFGVYIAYSGYACPGGDRAAVSGELLLVR